MTDINALYVRMEEMEEEIRGAKSDRDDMLYELRDLGFMGLACIEAVKDEWDDHIRMLENELYRIRLRIDELEGRRYGYSNPVAYCG